VENATKGQVGYIYLSDMSSRGLNEFIEEFYPQIRKKGLIIDVRYNGGGFVDYLILERLRRVLVGMGMSRNAADHPIPENVFHGHLVAICNHYSASDGDIFPYYFQKYKLGPVIGTRTWGGVRGIRGYLRLLDGGYITVPEFSIYGLDSKWVIENHGVDPDIVVDNRPDLVVKGRDPQLEKAIEVIMEKIRKEPKTFPPRPPYMPPYPEQ
ncbi:MAG: protease, partial [Calditrichaeota bacterium]|nr:protease [Calditrichota bacterium]